MTDFTFYVLTEDWAARGYAGCASWYYTNYADAKNEFDKRIETEKSEGWLSDWLDDESHICEREDVRLEVWLDNDYMSEHYRLTITKAVLHVSDTTVERQRAGG